MRYQITHRTIYEYTEPVTVSHNAARLKLEGEVMKQVDSQLMMRNYEGFLSAK